MLNQKKLDTKLMEHAIVEQGTDNEFEYIKYADGRLEAERVYNVGTITLSTTETSNVKVSGDITIPRPSIMTGGTIALSYVGSSANSATFFENISETKVRIAKFTTSNITLNNVTFALRLVNGKWT